MDTTVRLGPLKFSLRATIDHHGPFIHSSHYTASFNCCKKKPFFATITQLRRLELLTAKLLYCICYTIRIDWNMIFGLEQEVGSLIAPMALAHPPHPIDNRSRNRRRNLWVGWCVYSWWPLFPSRSCVNIYIYIYICTWVMLWDVYIQKTGVSFSIGEAAPYHILKECISGECAVPGLNATFCFLWFTNCVLLCDYSSLIPRCLWLLAFVLNNTLILGIWCSIIPHLPGCFCPWTVFQIIGFNMVPSDPFMLHLTTQLGYSAGEFQALQLIVLATFGVVD